MSAGIPVKLVEPCPPHQWGHAPTVGYFRCSKCDKHVWHNNPEYSTLLAERAVGSHAISTTPPIQMDNQTATPMEGLVERLRMKEHRGKYMPGGGSIDAEGKGTMWGGEKYLEPVNPDGPEAADAIETLANQKLVLEQYCEASGKQIDYLLAQQAESDKRIGELEYAADFLCRRVRELEGDMVEGDTANEYYAHVIPALARMEAAIKDKPNG